MICSRGLQPGDRLDSEKQLCEHFGVSRPSLRKALRSFARQGRIHSIPGKGHYLTDTNQVLSQPGVIVCLVGSLQPGSLWANPHLSGIVGGVQSILEHHGQRVLIETRGPRQRPVRTLVQPYLSDLAGLVLIPLGSQTGEQMLAETPDVPRVVVGRRVGPELAPSVSVDHADSLQRATGALLDMGHRGIAFVDHSGAGIASARREQGYRTAMTGHLGGVDESMVLSHLPPELSVIRQALEQVLVRRDVTALLLTSFSGVLQSALQVAAEVGRRVPDDLSIIAIDDPPETRELAPAISAIRQPLGEMGRVAAHMLNSLLNGRNPQPAQVVLDSELVLRASTAAFKPEN